MGQRIDVNNEGGLDTRPSSLYWRIEPGCSSRNLGLAWRLNLHIFNKQCNYTVGWEKKKKKNTHGIGTVLISEEEEEDSVQEWLNESKDL